MQLEGAAHGLLHNELVLHLYLFFWRQDKNTVSGTKEGMHHPSIHDVIEMTT